METVTITFIDESKRKFGPPNRGGGSYGISTRYEAGFVIVTDEWGKETAYPAANVKQIESDPGRRGW